MCFVYALVAMELLLQWKIQIKKLKNEVQYD